MKNNNWETINEIVDNSLTKYSAHYGSPDFMSATKEITDDVSNLLTKKDQEHKAELKEIRDEIENKKYKQEVIGNDQELEIYNDALQDAIHIVENKLNE